ncbi:AraC family transcriptional regulator [Paenibacillus sp. GSMTC-2017]|uniref:AraC family transcriptional regulator n=1 Tax=Paenibacillus sp. GSMTC-2017 TaxID=2794350 RepID=UPI0018D68912|nr:AraC family transcriptional regulator [Paenibacillus sp. GSMTC-2017]MBH5318846.1 AraC family transcriptional regulator [Paenibacillus sp. GSMTC-2017]
MWLSDHIALWNRALINMIDIRHFVKFEGEELRGFILPSSFYLFAIRGNALLSLDGKQHRTEQFYVLHGGKGACLDIHATNTFEYYLILYKAIIPHPCRLETQQLLDRSFPFQLQYGLMPHSSLNLLTKVKEMESCWNLKGELHRLRVKALFYQCAHELFTQLYNDGVLMTKASYVSQATRFMDEHYSKPITLNMLSEMLDCSVGHLVKLFKREMGCSPIQYLNRIRITEAKELLLTSDASLEEISSFIGYVDKYYFSRSFKKQTGLSPIQYRLQHRELRRSAEYPSEKRNISIGKKGVNLYIGIDNHYQNKYRGELTMFKGTRAFATIIISLALLLSACSSNAPSKGNSVGGNQTATEQNTSTNTVQIEAGSQFRTVSTMHGEIKIPDKPERVVVDLYLGSFIALDVKPIGTPTLNLKNPYYVNELDGVENIGEYESISMEKVLSLQPDLIVTGNEAAYESFSKIAPTVVVPFGQLKTVHEEVNYFGKLLGKEKEATAWLSNYDDRIALAREKVNNAIPKEATFSIMQDWGKTVGVFGDNFGRGGQAIYRALDRKPPAAHAKEIMEKQSLEVSMEMLKEYAGDYIIFTSKELTLEDLKKDSIWSTFDAVKNDRVFIWKGEKSWYFDPIATLSQTEELAAWLAGE